MRQFIFITVLALTFFGCGNEGGKSSPQHAPSISNLQYSPDIAFLGQGGGSVTATGTIDFIDTDGNISTLTLAVYDLSGNQKIIKTIPITGIAGIKTGRIDFVAILNTTVKGDYTFKIYISDSAGLQSNTLIGTFSVI